MSAPKLTRELIKKIIGERKKGVFRRDTLIKYDISKPTYQRATKKGIKLGLLTLKEYKDLIEGCHPRGFEAKVKIHGEKEARQLCSEAWHEGIGKSHEKYCNAGDYENSPLVKAAIAGGTKTQDVASYVQKNIEGPEAYGQYPRFLYKGIEFRSKGELELALMLKECGLIKKIKKGKNCQMSYGSKTIDFVVDDTAIEYHPPKKGEINNYKETRIGDLREASFTGEIKIIEKLSFNELFQTGIVTSLLEYTKKIKTIKEKSKKIISLENQLKEVNKRIEKRERDKEYKVDEETIKSEDKDYDDKVPF
jgi:hypothetical protein